MPHGDRFVKTIAHGFVRFLVDAQIPLCDRQDSAYRQRRPSLPGRPPRHPDLWGLPMALARFLLVSGMISGMALGVLLAGAL
jgi:hypothetical protein